VDNREATLREVTEALDAIKRAVESYQTKYLPNWFVEEMEARLRANAYRGGWNNEKETTLINRLFFQVGQLEDAMRAGDKDIVRRAADVANFAMMIADKTKTK